MRCSECKYYGQKSAGEDGNVYDEICMRDGSTTEGWYKVCRDHNVNDIRMHVHNRVQPGVLMSARQV